MKRYGLQWNGPDNFVCTEMPDGLWTPYAEAEAALAEAVADAERYRWLRKHYGLHLLHEAKRNLLLLIKAKGLGYRGAGMALDVSIDVARKGER